MAAKLTGKKLTKVSKRDLVNAVDDGSSVLYSPDGKRLIKQINWNLEKYVIKEGTEVIADEAFYIKSGADSKKRMLKEVIIPNTVTHIGKGAFVACNRMKRMVLPDSITYLGECAFQACDSMEEIVLPDTLTHIGCMAFHQCSSLKHIVIPKNVRHIDSAAFCNCPNVVIESRSSRFVVQDGFLIDSKRKTPFHYFGKEKVVTMPKGIVRIDWPVFSDSDVEEVTIPDTVTTLGFRAFNNCHSLRKVMLPSTIKEVVGWTFTYCESLCEICVPKGCKEAYQTMMQEAVAQANNEVESMLSYRVFRRLNLDKYKNPEEYLSALLPVKYWDLLVEV